VNTLRRMIPDFTPVYASASRFAGLERPFVKKALSSASVERNPVVRRFIDGSDQIGRIVTGDAILRRKTITSETVGTNGDHVLVAEGNRREPRREVRPDFGDSTFPLTGWNEPPRPGHDRIDRHHVAGPGVEALGEDMRRDWPTVRSIVPQPGAHPVTDRARRRIGIMHRDGNPILGEDQCTNRLDHALCNIFAPVGTTLTLSKRIATSRTGVIEMIQDNRDIAPTFLLKKWIFFMNRPA